MRASGLGRQGFSMQLNKFPLAVPPIPAAFPGGSNDAVILSPGRGTGKRRCMRDASVAWAWRGGAWWAIHRWLVVRCFRRRRAQSGSAGR